MDAHQGGQRHGQGDDGAQHPPAGELRALEEEGERDADDRGQHHRRGGDPEAAPEGHPLVRPVNEFTEPAHGPVGRPAQRFEQRHQQRVAHQPGEQGHDAESGDD